MGSPQFTTNLLQLEKPYATDYSGIDSFVIFLCTSGSALLKYENGEVQINIGEAILLPAVIRIVELIPEPATELLEIYIS
jgi:mannose-6-phosphate isomerase